MDNSQKVPGADVDDYGDILDLLPRAEALARLYELRNKFHAAGRLTCPYSVENGAAHPFGFGCCRAA